MIETKNFEDIDLKENLLEDFDLKVLLKSCYQCGRCSGVCQISKVQKFAPSRIIQSIIEGYEDKVLNNGILWDCLTCNQCLKNCPQKINFADVVRISRYKMQVSGKSNPDDYNAHKGIYTTISEIMSKKNIIPKRDLSWIPPNVLISKKKGELLYYVGCLPFFNYEFDNACLSAEASIKIISSIENKEILVLKEELCCGHDLYWGQGKIHEFINLALKNSKIFEKKGVKRIITACAECYRTFKIDYPRYIKDFSTKFEVKHLIEYVYDKWKENKIRFITLKNEKIESFTFHDPCRLSRFLPHSSEILTKLRELFKEFEKIGYDFIELAHFKEDSLCCGVNSWMNCNENSKALRYKKMLEVKNASSLMLTSCPKCILHLKCIQNDYNEIAKIKIQDLSEFLIKHIAVIGENI